MKTFLSKILIAGFVLLFGVNGFGGQNPNAKPVSFGAAKPLGEILNPDGTVRLEKGLSGSFNPQGFRMITEPGKPPRFVPAEEAGVQALNPGPQSSSAAGTWDSRFTTVGASNDIYSCLVSDGVLYAGGAFTCIGDIPANYIAKWDGMSWSALGSGMNDDVMALAASGSDLYAGGQFTTAGAVSAKYIAKWNGTNWSALGSGMSGTVNALTVMGTDLYAGGWFVNAGGGTANYIAKWDGTSWSALGPGMNGSVMTLAVSGSDLYAGGQFTTAGAVSAKYIAKWNGTTWSALGSGMNRGVLALVFSSTDLYAGGFFTTSGGVLANYIAKWNGTNWSALGSGMSSSIYALAVSGSNLYAGGRFWMAEGVPVKYIAKWDGSSWSALGTGMNNDVRAFAVSGTDLYAGGSFHTAGGNQVNHIAKWNTDSWSPIGRTAGLGLDGNVSALVVSGTALYAGGSFTNAGGISTNYIAKWNGTTWSALGSGMNNSVFALAVMGTDLYAGGLFTEAGGVSANHIAKWNGTTWSALGSGIDKGVWALAVMGTDLYVGGMFTEAGGVPANHAAKWNGTTWSALGSGVNSDVFALAVFGPNLYVGGFFQEAGGIFANNIAKWDGSTWLALGSGVNNQVNALVVSGPDLYVGGYFTEAGGVPANRIAKWNGTTWSALSSGMNSTVETLAVMGTNIYVGGDFTEAGGIPVNHIAKWDGTSWSALGSGVDNGVSSLAVLGMDLYAGGNFIMAGWKPSFHFGIWYPSGLPVWLQVNKTAFVFGSTGGLATPSQSVFITNAGTGTLTWTAATNQPWLNVAPGAGSGSGVIQVTCNAAGLSVGGYSGTVTVTAPGAVNSPQTINVLFHVYDAGSTGIPFGSFDTPIDGSTVSSSIPVTGWALDDIEVTGVGIYRNPVGSEPTHPNGLVYIGDAIFVEGARPDIETGYPNYPLNSRGGWGYMMLTNSLPNGGNGTFVLSAIATDQEGHQVTLGQKTIICNNAQAIKPFGAIDTPTQGGTAFGSAFVNFGWALTPMSKSIPIDGSTITVYVDGLPLGHPTYNNFRPDIAMLFPGYANSNGAVGLYFLDTTGYSNGVHTIAWVVSDSGGEADGIGSRYFNVLNTGGGVSLNAEEAKIFGTAGLHEKTSNPRQTARIPSMEEIGKMFSDISSPIHVRRGFDFDRPAESVYPNREGSIRISIPELERVAIYLDPTQAWETKEELEARGYELLQANIFQRNDLRTGIDLENNPGRNISLRYSAYLLVGSELRPLPIGSTLDSGRGVLYWQPGPGFLGNYDFILVDENQNTKKIIKIRIGPM